MVSAAVVLQPERLKEMRDKIAKTAHQSMQYSRRHKDVVWERFAVLEVQFRDDGVYLVGHTSAPDLKDVKFEIHWGDDGNISLDIDHGGLGFDAALALLKREFPNFYCRSKVLGKPGGGGGGDLEGIYLWAGVPGKGGKANLLEAVRRGMFSLDFANTCMNSGVTAKKFGGRKSKKRP